MDSIQNPFSPGAGSPPSDLVGRDQVLRQTQILFGRVKHGKSEKSLLLTGLRGVGKTVLLNALDSKS
jgi:Cdc6-like AAA superfamily ATPase